MRYTEAMDDAAKILFGDANAKPIGKCEPDERIRRFLRRCGGGAALSKIRGGANWRGHHPDVDLRDTLFEMVKAGEVTVSKKRPDRGMGRPIIWVELNP